MPQYDLRDDLDGHPGATCIGRCMAPQIMRPEMNAHHTACFGHHFPCSLITYWKNELFGLNGFFPDIIFESVGESLGDENEFLIPTTLGISEGKPPLIDIWRGEFQHLFLKRKDFKTSVEDQR